MRHVAQVLADVPSQKTAVGRSSSADIIAAGLYLATRERGLRIPGDLSVIGFDDMDFARVLDPPLTTVALDAELLGAKAFELLEGRMAGRRIRRRIVLPAELLVRGSTAPPA